MEFGQKIRVRKGPVRKVRDRTLQRLDNEEYASPEIQVQERLGATDYPLEEVERVPSSDMQGEQQRLLLQRLQRQRVLRRQQGQAQARGEEQREVVDDDKGGAVFCQMLEFILERLLGEDVL